MAALAAAFIVAAGAAAAQQRFSIPGGPLSAALADLGRQAGVSVIAPADLVAGMSTPGADSAASVGEALAQLLAGTGLSWQTTSSGAVALRRAGTQTEGGVILLDSIILRRSADVVGNYNPVRSRSSTRTDTPLQDLPQSVNVVGREEVEDRQVQSLTQAIETVPNAQQNSTSGNRGDTFLLRGFTASAYAIDGSTLSAAQDRPEVFLDFANVERVEVLKGPEAVLYGQGEPGGMINVVTRGAAAEPGGEVSVSAGSYGFRRVEGTATGKLDEAGRLRARVTGALTEDGGFQTERPDSERQFASALLEWDATDATTLRFGADYTHQELPFDRGLTVGADNEVLADHTLWLGEDWSMIYSEKTRVTFDSETVAAPELTLRSHVAYETARTEDQGIDLRGLEDDGTTLNRRWTDRVEDQQNLDIRLEAEAQLQTGAVGHTLLGGVQYGWSEMDFRNARANIDPIDISDPEYGAEQVATGGTRNDYVETVTRRSAYLQDQMDLSAQWKLLAGVRFDDYDITRDVKVGSEVPDNGDSAWTGRLGLVYQPRPDLSFYGSWSQSFLPQSGVDKSGAPLDPEQGEQYEIGVKYAAETVSATLSAFQITKSNVATSDPDAPDADWSVVTGEQRVHGIEAEVTGALGEAWRLHGSLGLMDAEITEDEDYEVGNRLPGVPEVSGSLWATYAPQAAGWDGWSFGAGIFHAGKREGDLDNSYDVDVYTRLDVSVEWQMRDNLGLQVMVRNLTDIDYIVSPVGRTENYAGAPRTVTAKLTYSF
ncbi:TonB-dependent siderophore receptor [Mangrovicoccus algicola]|uniref:TonB-dependent receptor n=1 Tax=Mangrovicoccus algicola TaxID=2771008 RepID=A0A8J7CZ05_9RHOB|nr:TonB-dependent receptor [Mangrovicoccus algicola]MBE3637198.1 TonB-dependent receptor [Mangrovicoccus algicola]